MDLPLEQLRLPQNSQWWINKAQVRQTLADKRGDSGAAGVKGEDEVTVESEDGGRRGGGGTQYGGIMQRRGEGGGGTQCRRQRMNIAWLREEKEGA
ncbi:unnamed protein product [Victoria cruziana]